MQLAKVIGTTVSTAKDPQLGGHTLLLCAPCGLDGREEGTERFVAVDTVGAGEGEVVLVATGSAARISESTRSSPTDATIVGIVDTVRADGKTTYSKGR